MDLIYLDHNATTPLHPQVAQAMAECEEFAFANPASQHQAGRRARRLVEDARERIASLLGADVSHGRGERLVFTSGGAEANNLAILGLAGAFSAGAAWRSNRRLVLSAIEHPTVGGPADFLAGLGWDVQRLRVGRDGAIDLDHLRELLAVRTHLVSIMLANNETGVLQSVREAAALCADAGALLHSDAVQVAGKSSIDFLDLGVDALSLSAHKFHGPKGAGALLVRRETRLSPVLMGGFQEQGLRAGTQSPALAAGFLKALELWHAEAGSRTERLALLRDRFEQSLAAGDGPIVINGAAAKRLPHTSNVSFVGLDRQAMFLALDAAGVACSTGSACASGSSEPSPVLTAMGLPEEVISSSLRFSFGALSTAADGAEAARRILQCASSLRQRLQTRKTSATPRNPAANPL